MGDIVTGVDSSSACTSSSIACLLSSGMSFVGRYYSRTTHIEGKKLTQSEAVLISQSGLQLVAVYEDGPTSSSCLSGEGGAEDGDGGIARAQAVGQPAGSVIYFTVDYDATAADIAGGITAYFSALDAALSGLYVVGVYGSGAVSTAMTAPGLAKIAWLAQSTGWTGYSQFTNWAIKQGPEQSVCTLNSDSDIAHGEFGAFTVSS